MRQTTVRAVFFDVGETLVNEERVLSALADALSVPRHTFYAILGAALAQGGDYHDAVNRLQPGFDLSAHAANIRLTEADLYPDVLACLNALHDQDLFVGIAGNHAVQGPLRAVLAAHCNWLQPPGAAPNKPHRAFFAQFTHAARLPPQHILYVGDRIDNDIHPALDCGMQAAFLRRGPWAHAMPNSAAAHCTFTLNSLTALPGLLC
ncbi:HAD family hydrolase [Streptomyces globisporus]|uniref:HAD family hydrolase n=1 Tax=Streptomyces TaxID=1883 RepID=UPI0004C68EC4|nr:MULTISPECIES: HAD family hydrolase [Streptomyces]MYX04256.1 HAD hydrolase-like protein [Streptomyces sp. SID8378]RUP63594.1 flavin mononucleotide phosphatase [Streptomyces sp. NP10]SNB90976.1 FMN phosphatase YigB, HAD superfamily [Streptomyces sp. PgraA7]